MQSTQANGLRIKDEIINESREWVKRYLTINRFYNEFGNDDIFEESLVRYVSIKRTIESNGFLEKNHKSLDDIMERNQSVCLFSLRNSIDSLLYEKNSNNGFILKYQSIDPEKEVMDSILAYYKSEKRKSISTEGILSSVYNEVNSIIDKSRLPTMNNLKKIHILFDSNYKKMDKKIDINIEDRCIGNEKQLLFLKYISNVVCMYDTEKGNPYLDKPYSVLLYGPPGTGKTELIRAVIRHMKGLTMDKIGFEPIVVDNSFRSKWYGETINNLKSVLKRLNDNKIHLLVFDDVDAILQRRGENSYYTEEHILHEVLNTLEGLTTDYRGNYFVILSTNLVGKMDPALLSRITTTMYVSGPKTRDDYKRLIEMEAKRIGKMRPEEIEKISLFLENPSKYINIKEAKGVNLTPREINRTITEAGIILINEKDKHESVYNLLYNSLKERIMWKIKNNR